MERRGAGHDGERDTNVQAGPKNHPAGGGFEFWRFRGMAVFHEGGAPAFIVQDTQNQGCHEKRHLRPKNVPIRCLHEILRGAEKHVADLPKAAE